MKIHVRFAHLFLTLECAAALGLGTSLVAQEIVALPGTSPLQRTGDLSAQMVEGIHTYLAREIEQSVAERPAYWQRNFSSREAYERSVTANREEFQKLIGATDPRLPAGGLEFIGDNRTPS